MYAIRVPYIDLNQIYKSGQVYRWIKIADNKYIIPFKNEVVQVEQRGDNICFKCTEDKFYDVWWDYFDLSTDYSKLNNIYKRLGLDFKIKMNRASGIHILNQDVFEILITSIIQSEGFTIEEVEQMVYNITSKCGKKKSKNTVENGKMVWYTFPTPQDIIKKKKLLTYDDVGSSKEVILNVCRNIITDKLDLEELLYMDYEEAKEYLLQFKGINKAIANMVCLYSLHHLEAFPVGNYIKSLFKKELKMNYREFRDWFISNDNQLNNVGYLRQVLLYNYLYPPTEYNVDTEQYKNKKKRRK